MKKTHHRIRSLMLGVLCAVAPCLHAQEANEQLGMALEYFQSGKYHESLLILERLEQHYKLNPRYVGYMGVCYYYEWNFKKACQYLDATLPQLEAFAPHERAVYYFTDAESHFNLEQYEAAIPLYEQMLNVCFDNEKADAYYRLGFCYLFQERWPEAADYFESALAYYNLHPTLAPSSREEQIKTMLKGIQRKIDFGTEFAHPSTSSHTPEEGT